MQNETEMNELMLISDNSGCEYNLSVLPEKETPMLKQASVEILQDMQVTSIVQNMENVGRLMFIAYNALSGMRIQSSMFRIQKTYLDLMGNSSLTIISFEHRSEEICEHVAEAYKWLIKGKEGMSLKQFNFCALAAAEMADKAEELADGFKKLSDEVESVLEDTQNESALQYQKMDEMKAQLQQYNAELEKYKSLQTSLDADITSVNDAYQSAKKKENQLFDIKKGLMITQIVTSCIGATIPSASSVKSGRGSGNEQMAGAAQEALREKETEQKALSKEKYQKQVEAEVKDTGEKIQVVAGAIQKLNEQLSEYAASCMDDYQSEEETTKEIFYKKLELEKQRRETLASIQEFIGLLGASVEKKNVAETAVQTLGVAICCIKQVVVALSVAARFLRSMETYCKTLSDLSMANVIKDLSEELTLEERMECYQDHDFKMTFLKYMCRWAALYYVCDDYRKKSDAIRKMVENSIRSSASREEEWQMAGELAKQMGISINQQVEESKKVISELEMMKSLKENNELLVQMGKSEASLDFAQSGEEVYKWWLEVADAAVEKSKECTEIYQSFADKVFKLEDEKNTCYEQGDALKTEYTDTQSKRTVVETNISALKKEMEDIETEVITLEYRIKKLESDKKIYDVLRWIPGVNIVSEIVAATDGTRDELSRKKREHTDKMKVLEKLSPEKNELEEKEKVLEQQMQENEKIMEQLERQIDTYIQQRNEAAKEMNIWRERQNSYRDLAEQMKHLVAMGADILEFKQLLLIPMEDRNINL